MNLNILRLTLNNLLKPIVNNNILSRNYAFKSDLKIKWVRPEKIPCIKPEKSGDLKPLAPIDLHQYSLEYKGSKELENADEIVKKLFTLEYQPKYKATLVAMREMVEKVRRHPQDCGSMEVKIAKMTVLIRSMQKTMEEFPRNRRMKVRLKEMIDRRKKFLKYLRTWDYKRFEWLLEKLDLVYKPPPNEFHWITRKESLQKLTDKYCEDLKNERLGAYRRELEAQQEDFLKDKIQKLQFIRKEQLDCGVHITIEQAEIDATKKQLEELQKTKKMVEELEDKK